MDLFTTMFTAMTLLATTMTEAQTIVISRSDGRSVRPGPPEHFTGSARVETLFEAVEPSHAGGGSVTFEPGARTAWHSHPRGQILIVTAGTGRVQRWGDAIEEIRTGDVVRIPAGQKHWHGASPQASMTHMTVSEHRDGTAVQWMEKVSDEQYNTAPQPRAVVQPQGTTRPSGPLQQKLAPGLAVLTDDVLYGDVWKRTELSPRDRSLVTISVLIATGKPAQLAGHLGRALDNGVQPREASGVLAHLAIYSGWPNAVSALDVYDEVYTARKIDTAELRDATLRLPASASGAPRPQAINEQLGGIAPKFVQLTNDVVFDDLWRRSDLTVRDRSLVTIAALAAMGDDDQLDFYLRRATESGLTRAQISEAFTHLGFYAGWPKATKAITQSSGTAQKPIEAAATATTTAQKEVISLSKEKWRWMAERNVDALSALFHEDAVFVHMGGTMSRSQELEVIKTGGIHYKQVDIQDVSVKIVGTTAILLNRIRLVAVVGGNEVTNPFVVTEVYVQQGGTWKLGSLSFTRLLGQ